MYKSVSAAEEGNPAVVLGHDWPQSPSVVSALASRTAITVRQAPHPSGRKLLPDVEWVLSAWALNIIQCCQILHTEARPLISLDVSVNIDVRKIWCMALYGAPAEQEPGTVMTSVSKGSSSS